MPFDTWEKVRGAEGVPEHRVDLQIIAGVAQRYLQEPSLPAVQRHRRAGQFVPRPPYRRQMAVFLARRPPPKLPFSKERLGSRRENCRKGAENRAFIGRMRVQDLRDQVVGSAAAGRTCRATAVQAHRGTEGSNPFPPAASLRGPGMLCRPGGRPMAAYVRLSAALACLPIGLVNRSRHRLAKGAPNRNPEHERKRHAPSQQDADDNSAMPTAKFGISECCHLGSEARRWPFEHRAFLCGWMRWGNAIILLLLCRLMTALGNAACCLRSFGMDLAAGSDGPVGAGAGCSALSGFCSSPPPGFEAPPCATPHRSVPLARFITAASDPISGPCTLIYPTKKPPL